MSYLSYIHGRHIEEEKYRRNWPYYGMVLAAQDIMEQIMDADAAKMTVFAEMLRRFGRADEFHRKAADEYAALALEHSWTIGGLIQALMRRGDTQNRALLVDQFPDMYADLVARYDAPGGRLPHELKEYETECDDNRI